MKFFRKINLGVIALLIVVISVAVYMIYMNGKHNDLEKKADDFITSFFESDADWATIPEEYRKDSKSYIESIEKDAKKYFCDDGAYDYYIKNAILSQYESNSFFDQKDRDFNDAVIFMTGYDGETFEISLNVDTSFFSGDVNMTLIETDDGFKIKCLDYPFPFLANDSTGESW